MRCYICDYHSGGLSDQEVDDRTMRKVKMDKSQWAYICSHCDDEVTATLIEMEEESEE